MAPFRTKPIMWHVQLWKLRTIRWSRYLNGTGPLQLAERLCCGFLRSIIPIAYPGPYLSPDRKSGLRGDKLISFKEKWPET